MQMRLIISRPVKQTTFWVLTLVMLIACPAAHGQGQVLLDQVGPADGSGINTLVLLQNQLYADEPNHPGDVAMLEAFDNPDGLPLARVETVIFGATGYGGVDGIAAMVVAIFSSPACSTMAFIGDVLTVSVEGPPMTDPDWAWAGTRDLVIVSGGPWPCPAGSFYAACVPINEFSTNGVVYQVGTYLADDEPDGDVDAWRLSRNTTGGWVAEGVDYSPAMRIVAGPCALPLSTPCNGDVTGATGSKGPDGIVDVNDLLLTISEFGAVGDGLTRPLGDCAPLPYGDCEVGVDDLLAVIAQFGDDCIPRGACCIGLADCTQGMTEDACAKGGGVWIGLDTDCSSCALGACCRSDLSCEEVLAEDCAGLSDLFHGAGVACDDVVCVPPIGACCLIDLQADTFTCLDSLDPKTCAEFGGEDEDIATYMGAGTTCADVQCQAVNDTCQQATSAILGPNAFATWNATDSGFPPPDDSQCPTTNLNWGNSRDVWFKWSAAQDTLLTLSTCDAASYDTSIVAYLGPHCGALVQVACNGDTPTQAGCQTYYSRIDDLIVLAGETLWIRIGGFDGATGSGTLLLDDGDQPQPGACCVDGTCIGDLLAVDCAQQDGVWLGPLLCATAQCPQPATPCQTGIGEDPINPLLDWTSGTSDEGDTYSYLRAQAVDVDVIERVTVYGLAMSWNNGWAACNNATMHLDLYAWADDGTGQPGQLLVHIDDALITGTFTGTMYPTPLGGLPLVRWTIEVGLAQQVDWLAVQSNSFAWDECMFLWMSASEEQMGHSLFNEGNGWTDEYFSLNYCIDNDDPLPTGACCIGGDCEVRSQVTCLAMGGDWRCAGSSCNDFPCDALPWTASIWTPDLDGNGQADLIRRVSDCALEVWSLVDGEIVDTATIATPGPNWSIVATADANGDGKDDIYWQAATGHVEVTIMDGLAAIDTFTLYASNTNWTVGGAAMFQASNWADLLWQAPNGDLKIFHYDSDGTYTGSTWLDPEVDYRIQGAASIMPGRTAALAINPIDGTAKLITWTGVDADCQTDMPAFGPGWTAVGLSAGSNQWTSARTDEGPWSAQATRLTEDCVMTHDDLPVPDQNWQAMRMADFDGDGLVDQVFLVNDATTIIIVPGS
jgi:hypothetical protein